MIFFYTLGLYLYRFGIQIASLSGNEKARQWLIGRKNQEVALLNFPVKTSRRFWFHCSSLGEFEQGRFLLEQVRKQFPNAEIILTFFSPSGYEIRKNYKGADHILYLPLDSPSGSARFLDQVKPDLVFFIKYDYWYYFLKELSIRKIPVYMVSAIFRPSQRFFHWNGSFFRKMLRYISHFFVQDEESVRLLSGIGIRNVTLSGDTRFDRVAEIAAVSSPLTILDQFKGTSKLFIAGSTWPADENLLVEQLPLLFEHKFKVVFAPHEVSGSNIQRLTVQLNKAGIPFQKYSSWKKETQTDSNVLLLDTIGILSSVYRYGEIAYIGGGFGKGIHNTLEAAAFGLPVIFGPEYSKFREARELLRIGAGFTVNSPAELGKTLSELLDSQQSYSQAGEKAKKFIHNHLGATAKILELVRPALDGRTEG